jgi:leucyl-tRNA synthetase
MTERDELPHRYDAALADRIETKWQEQWDKTDAFRVANPGERGFDASKPKYYVLDMFPYPSAAGLHVGHPEGYTATDIVSRYKRMRGFNVLHPMGWDAFGLPAEQYAIKTGVHPAKTTRQAIENFRRQLKRFGFSYDWSREFGTIDEDYYKFTQWIFLLIYESWFDDDANKARPMSELEAELASGKRAPRINPRATEFRSEEKARAFGAWSELSYADQRVVLDSYRLCFYAEAAVNWCPKLGTVLANEEIIDGKSERGGFPVFKRMLKQWHFRITAYADRFVQGLADLDWPRSTAIKQEEWVGKSVGAEIDFAIVGEVGGAGTGPELPSREAGGAGGGVIPPDLPTVLRVFTTRPDTIFGATYMVVAPEHPLVDAILARPLPETDAATVREYVGAARHRSDLERQASKEKTGIASGAYAINPATGARIPIWISDYVLMGYGTGAIMAVPGGDERDFEFATAFDLPIVMVVKPADGSDPGPFYTGEGIAIRSANDELSLDGLQTADAKAAIIEWLEKKGLGEARVNFRLRDWIFSRQRYWGEPFPIVFDEVGHHHPVSMDSLPLKLPPLEDYAPEESEDPRPLLAKATSWVTTTAGSAHVPSLPANTPVRRETNTMPGWAGSCWYFLRYCDPKNPSRFAGESAERYWMGDKGIDLYIGGNEHATTHLLYSRFWHMVLFDFGQVSSPEPFHKLFHQGMIVSHAFRNADKKLIPVDEVENRGSDDAPKWVHAPTAEEVERIVAKMSKSLKNVTNPDDVIAEFGADTFRLYEMYMGPLEVSKPWNPRDIAGMYRFLQRTWRLTIDEETGATRIAGKASPEIEKQLHRTIAGVTEDLERLAFHTAIAKLIGFVNAAGSVGLTRDQLSRFLPVLSVFTPHIAQEIWHRLGEESSLAERSWPTWEEAMLRDATVEIAVQILGKLRGRIEVPTDADAKAVEDAARADPAIEKELAGKTIKKVIVVPKRLVNFVVA